MGLRPTVGLKFGTSPAEQLVEAVCRVPPAIRAEFPLVCPVGNGGTDGAFGQAPGANRRQRRRRSAGHRASPSANPVGVMRPKGFPLCCKSIVRYAVSPG